MLKFSSLHEYGRPAGRPPVKPLTNYRFSRMEFTNFETRNMGQNPLEMLHFNLRYACSSGRLLFCARLRRPVVLVYIAKKTSILMEFMNFAGKTANFAIFDFFIDAGVLVE